MKNKRISIYPFQLSEVSECTLIVEKNVIASVQFLLQVNEAEELLCFRAKELETQIEIRVESDLNDSEFLRIFNALRSYNVEDAADVLKQRGITDLISIYELRKIECMIGTLGSAYKETGDAVLTRFAFYQLLREFGIKDVLGMMQELRRQGFFVEWDRELLFRVLKKRLLVCTGSLVRIGVRQCQLGKAFVGTIEPDKIYKISESEMPELRKRRSASIRIKGITSDMEGDL